MSKRIARVEPAVTVIVGVDTHKHVHVAVAVDRLGARLGSCSVPANRGGYAELVAWARTLGAVEAFGIGPDASAEMMIVAGDNPSRIRSDAAFAKLCGAYPIPASSGVTNRHRLFRGGHRQANATLYRIVIVRMRWHQPTIDYVARRTAQGLSKKDILRCLKRFVAREIYNALIEDHRLRAAHLEAA